MKNLLAPPVCAVLLAGCLAVSLAASQAAAPRLQPLVQPGKWLPGPRSEALDVKVAGHRAYVVFSYGGLQVIDVSNPTNCVRVGG